MNTAQQSTNNPHQTTNYNTQHAARHTQHTPHNKQQPTHTAHILRPYLQRSATPRQTETTPPPDNSYGNQHISHANTRPATVTCNCFCKKNNPVGNCSDTTVLGETASLRRIYLMVRCINLRCYMLLMRNRPGCHHNFICATPLWELDQLPPP